MKFAMKSLVAAAAIAATGIASAATITVGAGQKVTVFDPNGSGRSAEIGFVNGAGELAFSNTGFDGADTTTLGGLISALNVGQVKISGLGGATVAETSLAGTRVTSAATAQVVSITANDVTGDILSVGSTGGAKQLGTFISGTLTGGYANVTNLRFDLANKAVIADLYGVKDAVGTKAAVTYDLPNTTLWTIDTITGPTAIKPEYLLAADPVAAMTTAGFQVLGSNLNPGDIHPTYTVKAENVISGLRITTAGFNFFKNSLGLGTPGINALAAVNNNVPVLDADGNPTGEVLQGGYGTVRSSIIFTVREVPEPSTYALMGLGLVGISLVARRRAK